MRLRIVVPALLALSSLLLADDYPKPSGFVNDFANQLPLDTLQSLEQRLQEYERASGNEVAVAVVPSLNGSSVEDYARGLFRAWGIGKYGTDNGVLFLWAPGDRKIRIQVGRGLEDVLTPAQSGKILLRVQSLFRNQRYADGVGAAIDGIIGSLGSGQAAGASGESFVRRNSPEALARETREAARRRREAEAERTAANRSTLTGFAFGVGIALALLFFWRRSRAARWREELPQAIEKSEGSLTEADQKRAQAQVDYMELRKEAPEEVWRAFEARLREAPAALNQLRADLDLALLQPRQSYGELRALRRILRRWRQRMGDFSAGLSEVGGTLVTLRQRRDEARSMLGNLSATLVRLEGQGVPGGCEGLVNAAAETYNQALSESEKSPANWLLVYDLLADVAACLERIENPAFRVRYQPVRYWGGYAQSPAAEALALMYAASGSAAWQANRDAGTGQNGGGSWEGGDAGGDSAGSGDDFGGFGGGDSGGAGSSSDY